MPTAIPDALAGRQAAGRTSAREGQASRVWAKEFTADHGSVRLARNGVHVELVAWGWARERADDVALICSELVTNAIRHACRPGDSVLVRLQESAGGCRLEVRDSRSDLMPATRPAGVRQHGHGLRLVAAVSEDWGVARGKGAKVVWARVLQSSADENPGEAA
ncbi:ATP-binding protein [Kitasatospora sp. NPDC051914]|uniref:ATP-binding protein n=1 Tax=Kitasatospora sp. NPDC051914 TaxID=3154945 RepID=UPI0034359965